MAGVNMRDDGSLDCEGGKGGWFGMDWVRRLGRGKTQKLL